MTTVMLVTMLTLFALSIPVAVSIGLASAGAVAATDGLSMIVLAQQLFIAIDKYPLAAIPFFIFAGNLMEAGGISRRLVEVAKSLVGGVQGGLAAACIVTCMILASVSGSSVATTFAIGAILIPALVRHGYPKPFATSLQASAAELGVVIPPSIPMILYGVAAEVSISDLFIAGLGPGLLIATAMIVTVIVWAKIKGYGKDDHDERQPLLISVKRAGFALLMPFIILGGIYGGVFTPTEASVIAVIYALLIGAAIHRELTIRDFIAAAQRSVRSSSVIMLIIASAGLFSFLISRAGIPALLGEFLIETLKSPVLFLLGVNLALLIVGMFIETSASIIILAPILAPVAVFFGVDPVQFGVIMTVNLALGMITPPLGVNLFAASSVANLPIDKMIKPLLVFIAVVLSCLMTISFVPAISLGIRDYILN